jgi:hypothetical protein
VNPVQTLTGHVVDAGRVGDGNWVSGENLAGSNDRKVIPLSVAVTVPVTTMNLNCGIRAGGAAHADEIFLTAIEVGAVTTQ